MIKKLPKCRHCKERFTPFYNNALQPYCMRKDECIKAHLDKQAADNEKRLRIRAKNKRKDNPTVYLKENKKQLQDLVQHIARLIDKGVKCIDCDIVNAQPCFDGGHFRAKNSHPAIRYNLHNIFQQARGCNHQGQTSEEKFLRGIEEKYGKEYASFCDDLTRSIPYLGMKAQDYPAHIATGLKIVLELKKLDLEYTPKQRIKLRTKYNNRIGIYLDNE